ncbi:MAG: OmpA family protein [Polyangiaceae bacterium]|nr:OmpA family protein [Polyangiaceae bacterium]MCW5789905.1 OmpA family protein [Polyangiaceae bacterium]
MRLVKSWEGCVALALVSVSALGCVARGSASARGSAGARTGGVEASGSVKLEGGEARWRPVIQYADGRLDYRGDIEFEYDSAELRNDAGTTEVLKQLVAYLQRHPDVHLQVEGHTDSRGSEIYNRELSKRRAASLKKRLVEEGIDERRLTSVGYGESRPAMPEPPECHNRAPADPAPCQEAWQKNRRAVFTVTAGAAALAREAEQEAPRDEEVEELGVAQEPSARPAVAEVDDSSGKCPQRLGLHVNLLGPNAVAGAAFAAELTCWLEVSAGLSVGVSTFETERGFVQVDGTAVNFTVPGRLRFWPMERHSIVFDVGAMFSSYGIEGESDTPGIQADYEATATSLGGFLGVGYGYRSSGRFRIAALLGVQGERGELGRSRFNSNLPAFDADVYQAGLDDLMEDLFDAAPYLEVSLGWLW